MIQPALRGAGDPFEEAIVDTIIFIPGGGGSVLRLPGDSSDDDPVWPPSLFEFITHYDRLQELLDPRLQATDIVNTIPLNSLIAYPVYAPILSDLYQIRDQTQANLIPFPYDFRKSICDSAAALVAQIEACYNGGSRSIALVCHSTGNQVARAVLENVGCQKQGWFGCLTLYVGICGPHFGVPEVLEYGLGLSDWLSITPADMQKFSRDPRYPGMYQLFPFKGIAAHPLVDVNTGPDDIYDASVATEFSLDQGNLDAAIELQAALDFSNKPPGVEYAIVAASGQPTHETIQYDHTTFVDILKDNAGDGTVPLWSSAPSQFAPFVTPGDHIGVLGSYPFRNHLWNLLAGADAPSLLVRHMGVDGVAISIDRRIYAPDEAMSVLVIPDKPTTQIDATIEIERANPIERMFHRSSGQPLAYRGPPIGSVAVEMTAPTTPGLYRITLGGKTHSTAPLTAATFAVSAYRRRR